MELFYKLGRYVNTKYTDIDAIVAEWISKQELSAPDKQEEEKEMKIVYIAHPISGDVKGNLEKIRRIIRGLNLMFTNIVPFAHYFVDCYALDDTVPEERDRGIKNDIALFKAGFIDEVWLFGDRISNGMKAEIELAKSLNIPIISKSDDFDFPTDDKQESHSDQTDDEEPKHPTSWRDFTMTDKVETPDKAIIDDNKKVPLFMQGDGETIGETRQRILSSIFGTNITEHFGVSNDIEKAAESWVNDMYGKRELSPYFNASKADFIAGYKFALSSLQSKPKVSDEKFEKYKYRTGQGLSEYKDDNA
jgi:hypothetical protein